MKRKAKDFTLSFDEVKDEMQIKDKIQNENVLDWVASGYIIKSTRPTISVDQFRSKRCHNNSFFCFSLVSRYVFECNKRWAHFKHFFRLCWFTWLTKWLPLTWCNLLENDISLLYFLLKRTSGSGCIISAIDYTSLVKLTKKLKSLFKFIERKRCYFYPPQNSFYIS